MPPCNSWLMSFSGNARNPISTIYGTGDWYIPAELNNLNAPCNSSPTFSNKPIAVVCNGQSFYFNHGAVDPDGDSLSYTFYAPNINSGVSVTYNLPYSASNFVQSSTPIVLDPVTGDLSFTPSQILTTLTGIRVDEWREINGVQTIIGSVFRDIQIKVSSCTNLIPTLSGIDTLLTGSYNANDTIYYIERCLNNTPIIFHINGHNLDTLNPAVIGNPEKFHISWNNGITGAIFNTFYNGTDSAYASFSWLPSASDVSNTPKCFTATIHDEACTYYGSQTFSYCIVVSGMPVDIGTDTFLCQGENVTFNAIADTSTVNYIWRMDGITTGTPFSQNSYTVNSSNLSMGQHFLSIETNDGTSSMTCPGFDNLIIDIVYQPDINGKMMDSAFCQGGAIWYDAGPGNQYWWSYLTGGGFTFATVQSVLVNSSGMYRLEVNGGQNSHCRDVDTFQVIVLEQPDLGNDTCIWLSNSPLVIDAGAVSLNNIYTWNTGDNVQTISTNHSGNYSVTISNPTVSPSVGCSDDRIVNIIDQDNFILSIPYSDSEDSPELSNQWMLGNQYICTFQSLMMKGPDAPLGHTYPFIWFMNGNQVHNSDYYSFNEPSIGSFEILLNLGGCIDSILVTTENCEVDIPNVITPNSDSKNDEFRIVIKGTNKDFFERFPKSKLIVYNRWGSKVFESNNYQNNWNGGGILDGIYYYTLVLSDGNDTNINGMLTIVSK